MCLTKTHGAIMNWRLPTWPQFSGGGVRDNFFEVETQDMNTPDWYDDAWWRTITANMSKLSHAMKVASQRTAHRQ